ncbi:MAG: hypothetical protein V8Q82_04100 [Christensenellales bacterium]
MQHIIKGLNSAGFSDKDYRLAEPVKPQVSEQPPVQIDITELQGVSDTEAPSETDRTILQGWMGNPSGQNWNAAGNRKPRNYPES